MERIKELQRHIGGESDSEDDVPIVSNLKPLNATELTIGGVTVRIEKPKQLELVPMLNNAHFADSQDMFLIGPPGPFKRNLVQMYAQLANREVEYVALSKDMTDGDLKQRREIQSGTAFYTDQASVRAAIHGRILILDGIEKAERNVLPIINNLLENREMALDDGRFLVHPKRYDSLMESRSTEEMEKWKLVRTSEKFIVIGLGLPVPKYDGHPLDPPLRSRFQARNINTPTFLSQITRLVKIAPKVPQKTLERLISVGIVLRAESATSIQSGTSSISIPEFPSSVEPIARIMNAVSGVNPRSLLDSIYPYNLMGVLESEQKSIIESAYQRFDFNEGAPPTAGINAWLFDSFYRLGEIRQTSAQMSIVSLVPTHPAAPAHVSVKSGVNVSGEPEFFVQTEYHRSLLASLILAHSVSDFCIVGEKGVGKSALLRAAIKLLGYRTEYIPLYKDMSARDLLQRRSTNLKGDTIWESSALIKAAVEGSVAILDQIEVAAEGVIASIQSLICEREISLPDGTLLVSQIHYNRLKSVFSDSEMTRRRIIKVHPSFRIVALARPKSESGPKGNWLSPELLNLFVFVPMRTLSYDEEREVIVSICPGIQESLLNQLLAFANKLRSQHDETLHSLAAALSTRQLIRCVRRLSLFPEDSLYEIILKAQLSQFLPSLTKEALVRLLRDSNIAKVGAASEVDADLKYEVVKENGIEVLRIGNVSYPVSLDSNKLLIPDIVFFDNPKQTSILREMLKDFILGEHLLLIGNQGVGKNKLVDRLLQLLQLPREYIQLHRDTTIHSLTSTPTIVNGVLVYEDSPLVRAAREGYILVVDEADKAPTHVTSVLKSLVEDGEMVLSDGRRLVYRDSGPSADAIQVHKNFRMFVLANRPGFPFLGNDFYGEIGDVFAAHCIGNPDKLSELHMLKKYAPSVDEDILIKLIDAFNDLRLLVDEGLINYPYSTRELVSVVKHLESFPKEGLSRALENVFDFDSYDTDVKELIITTLSKNGVHIGMQSDFKVELGVVRPLPVPEELEAWNSESVKVKKKEQVCVAETARFQLLGGWPLKFHEASSDSEQARPQGLQRIDARSVTFTEQMYGFKIPCNGEVLGVCRPSSSSAGDPFYVISTNPICLFLVDGAHRKLQILDLYEFFPLQKNIPNLKMVEVLPGILCLHNPNENTLLVLNMNEKKVYSMIIDFANAQAPSKMLPLGDRISGVLVFYQTESKQMILIDFLKSAKLSIALPVQPLSIHVADPKNFIWFVQSASAPNGAVENHILRKSGD
ncbi:von Willebrand factor A domain-containing protein 8, partial [Podochytrium sp. JEL0797]